MSDDQLKPHLEDLQHDVLSLLGKARLLVHEASQILGGIDDSVSYIEYVGSIDDEIKKVGNLELVMTVVAPMKAGKSTILNAIIGQELLPSRNSAMTSIPTEILLDNKASKPILSIPAELVAIFDKCSRHVTGAARELKEEELQKRIGQYPHLRGLLEKLMEPGIRLNIEVETIGRENIISALEDVNDLVRLIEIFAPHVNPVQYMREVPRIRTPFWAKHEIKNRNLLGNLVIVDTPGPNEANVNVNFNRIVREQLRKSSLVLIVLDFTGLKSTAAEHVKEDVNKVIEMRGTDNLYVLVNKIDQRRKSEDGHGKDMTPDEVKEFVRTEMKVGSSDGQEEKVYEISARWAFAYITFMQAVAQNPEVPLNQLPAAKKLAQELYPTDWEEELKDITSDKLMRKAHGLWRQSGFGDFVDKSIQTLMEEVGPAVMKGALVVTQSYLASIQSDLVLRAKAIASDASKVNKEINALDQDLKSLLRRQGDLRLTISQAQTNLEKRVHAELDKIAQDAEVSLDDVTNVLRVKKRSRLSLPPFLASLMPRLQERKIVEVSSKGEADRIESEAGDYALYIIETLLDKGTPLIERALNQGRVTVMRQIKEETKPIVEGARTRLNEVFDINLELPEFDPERYAGERVLPVRPQVAEKMVTISQGYTTVKKRRWYTLWLFKVDTQVKLPDKHVKRYTYSLADLVNCINQAISRNMDSLKEASDDYLRKDLKERVDMFYGDLDVYLRNYQASLRDSFLAKQLSAEQQKDIMDSMDQQIPRLKNVHYELGLLLARVTQQGDGRRSA